MEEERIKMAMVATASEVLKFKEKNPSASDQQTLQHITDNSDKIIKTIDDEDW